MKTDVTLKITVTSFSKKGKTMGKRMAKQTQDKKNNFVNLGIAKNDGLADILAIP